MYEFLGRCGNRITPNLMQETPFPKLVADRLIIRNVQQWVELEDPLTCLQGTALH